MPDASPIRDLESTDELRPDGRHILPMLAAFAALGTLSTTIILPAFPSLAPVHLGLFYAATVFVVFGAGMAAPGLARSTGVHFTIVVGLSLALLGGCLLFLSVHAPSFWSFAAAIVAFLAGFGLANPVMTAAALQPFGRQAGIASVLLGFVQWETQPWRPAAAPHRPFLPLRRSAASSSSDRRRQPCCSTTSAKVS